MSEKIEPCAWCGKEPTYRSVGGRMTMRCETEGCLMWRRATTTKVSGWNARQATILEQRRRDFDAGIEYSTKWVNVPSHFTNPDSIIVGFEDKQPICVTRRKATFDDYLERGK